MTELKSYIVYTPMDEVAKGIHGSDSITIEGNEVYLKSEADKVIAELNIKIKLYEDLGSCNKGCPALRHNQRRVQSEIYKVELKEKEIRHHKYKRCLAMAKWCAKNVDHLNSEGYIYEKEGHTEELGDCNKGAVFYHKWYERWLELAENFKEHK